MGNTSLCLMKLLKFREAKDYLELMMTSGSQKLKFYLRLATCYQSLGQLEQAKLVLEKRASNALTKEKDQALIRKYSKILNSVKTEMRKEESKEDDLFRKCFNLKSARKMKENSSEDTVKKNGVYLSKNQSSASNGNNSSVSKPQSKIFSILSQMFKYLKSIGPSFAFGILTSFGYSSIGSEPIMSKALGVANFGLLGLVKENWDKKERMLFTGNFILMMSINGYWVREILRKRSSV